MTSPPRRSVCSCRSSSKSPNNTQRGDTCRADASAASPAPFPVLAPRNSKRLGSSPKSKTHPHEPEGTTLCPHRSANRNVAPPSISGAILATNHHHRNRCPARRQAESGAGGRAHSQKHLSVGRHPAPLVTDRQPQRPIRLATRSLGNRTHGLTNVGMRYTLSCIYKSSGTL